MKRWLIGVVCWSCASFAQQGEMDSLVRALTASPHDTTRLRLLTELAYKHYPYVNPEKGLESAEEAIRLAKTVGTQAQLGYAYRAKGINHWALSEYASALELYSLAQAEYHGAADEEGVADTYNNIGVVYYSMASYPKALEYYLMAMSIYERRRSKRLANTLTNIGIIHKNLSEPARALEYYRRALYLYEAAENHRGVALTLANMGNAYDDLDSMAQALDHHRRAARINQSTGNVKGWANNLNSIGIIYSGAGDYAQGLHHLRHSLHLYEDMGEKNSMAVALMEIGKIYMQAPEGFLRERGMTSSTRYSAAHAYTAQALQLAEEIGARDRQATAWEYLSTIYERERDYAKALDAYRRSITLRDSVASDRTRADLTMRTMQFEFDKKEALLRADHQREQELAFEKLKQQRMQNNSILGGTALLLLAGVTTFVLYKRRKEAEFRTQVAETEMKALRAQMNPHFIFNSLNSINDYIAKHDTVSADYYLTKFARLMRLTLENSEKREVTLADDLHALELYMQLESMRLNRKFAYEICVADDINREETLVPPLLLQPFVENSIWHGIAPKHGEGRISIRIQSEDGMIRCTVEDNGVGRSQASTRAVSSRQSLGIKLTKARIDILNRSRQTNAEVRITDLGGGTRVEMRLPFVAAG
ncbi:MAG TPA: tetratricopeptide repeat protein [Bacteroidota bacterium]|nr:tetratricopeptide repeat protein [Bacteroidota bacterium]